ncbi:hypothetical protein ANN_20822 [Periplaneta americana]|uniref:Uncharacterized protein n=1 Tax=Periplaneta americana TaxID=6978 RepID=A0ABQ8SDP3_PERAM|nr:hypothetical protein ANN_20822 [Periplaneta americana]
MCDVIGNKGFDPVREIIIPGIIVMTIGAMVYLGIKLFCNCGKLWRRRRRQLTRELDEASHQQQATWVASYRGTTSVAEGTLGLRLRLVFAVFSSLNGMETRSSPVLSPSSSFPLHPTPCMGLFLPSGSLAAAAAASTTASATSPPPYEEALKHKVILSSYPSATTVILPTAPPTQGPPGTAFPPNHPGGPN